MVQNHFDSEALLIVISKYLTFKCNLDDFQTIKITLDDPSVKNFHLAHWLDIVICKYT